MIPALLSFAMVLPAQVLCLLPVWHQLKPGRHKTVILLAVLDAVLLPAGAWITFRYGLDINYILLPLLLLFFGVYQHCLKCPFCKSLSVFMSVCALMAILCNLACAIEAALDPSAGAALISLRSALIQLAVNSAAAALLFPVKDEPEGSVKA